MIKEFHNRLKGALIVPLGLFLVLIPFSMLVGWNLLSAILFWLIIMPAVTIYLPLLISKNKNHLWESLIGMTIFYAIMVFMIYDHYQTDYFQIMMVSFVINVVVVSMISWTKRHWRLTGSNLNNTYHLQV